MMISFRNMDLENGAVDVLEVEFPDTKLISMVVPDVGYIMCSMINVLALDAIHPERGIVAARFVKVREAKDLLDHKALETTNKAQELGIHPGMTGREILNRMLEVKEERKLQSA